MFPIATDVPPKTTPWTTYTLAASNIAIHLLLTWQTEFQQTYATIKTLGFTPAYITSLSPLAIPTLFISMFLHGNLGHLLGNMLFLITFGRKLETQLQETNYLIFYLASGIAATMTHSLVSPHCTEPLLGASGAISGVIGAFLVYNPRARITMIPDPVLTIITRRLLWRVPAWIFVPVWFWIQITMAGSSRNSGIAFWAHIGGFIMGLLMAIAVYKYIPKDRLQFKRHRRLT